MSPLWPRSPRVGGASKREVEEDWASQKEPLPRPCYLSGAPQSLPDPALLLFGWGFVLMVQLLRFHRGSSRRLAASMEAWDRLGEGELLASSASEHKDPAEPRRKLGGALHVRHPVRIAGSSMTNQCVVDFALSQIQSRRTGSQ
jgi:hypothetical protein